MPSRRVLPLLACLFFALLVTDCSSGPVMTTFPSGSPEARVEQTARKTNWGHLPGWSRDQPMAAVNSRGAALNRLLAVNGIQKWSSVTALRPLLVSKWFL
ncbi:hypothetical protein [Salinicola socius]|uniref:hypothetical protein n=1 Tax=Salinicola socius TaxID=404433 RepID=UPI001428CA23|nr:hypothetical protein [Salinicola socius]